MSREWSGANDETVTLAPGGLTAHLGLDCTYGILWRPLAVEPMGLFHAFAGGNGQWGANPFSDGKLYVNANGGFASSDPSVYTAGDGWRSDFITIPTFGGNARFHTHIRDTDTWTHADKTGVGGVYGAPLDLLQVGYYVANETLNGRIAALGIWSGVQLNDGQVEGTVGSLGAWLALGPTGLWGFNQPSTADPVLDLTGNGADEIAVVGTSVSADEPAGWSYSLAASPYFVRSGDEWVPATVRARLGGEWVEV